MAARDVDEKAPVALYVLVFVLSGVCAGTFSAFVNAGRDFTIRNIIIALIGAITILFLLESSRIAGTLSHDNAAHPARFVVVYVILLLCALLFTFVQDVLWSYAVIFAMLTFVSNAATGFCAGAFFLLLSVLFVRENALAVYGAYLTGGAFTVAWFQTADKQMKTGRAAVSAALMQGIAYLAMKLLTGSTRVSFSALRLCALNCVITALLLFVCARLFMTRVIRHSDERYTDINDTEFSLMAAIRAKSKDEYFRAIHTAYLTDKVSEALNLRTGAAHACAAYHRIGCLDDTESVWPDVAHYYAEFEFPTEAITLIKEYLTMGRSGPESKEVTVVYLCEELVGTLSSAFQKNKDVRISYDDTIETLFSEKRDSGYLSRSALTMKEYEQFKSLLKQEKLYYDLLR